MMSETLKANGNDDEWEPQPLTVLGWAMVFGWAVGVLMGLGIGVAIS